MALNSYFNRVILRRHRRRYQRNIINRQMRQRRRIMNRIYRSVTVNNADILSRIAQLPPQLSNDSFTNQLFNGINMSKYECSSLYILYIYFTTIYI